MTIDFLKGLCILVGAVTIGVGLSVLICMIVPLITHLMEW